MRTIDDQPIRRRPPPQPCPRDQPEPRGPGIHFAGLCSDCGQATIHYDRPDSEPIARCHGQHTTAGDQP